MPRPACFPAGPLPTLGRGGGGGQLVGSRGQPVLHAAAHPPVAPDTNPGYQREEGCLSSYRGGGGVFSLGPSSSPREAPATSCERTASGRGPLGPGRSSAAPAGFPAMKGSGDGGGPDPRSTSLRDQLGCAGTVTRTQGTCVCTLSRSPRKRQVPGGCITELTLCLQTRICWDGRVNL